MTSLHSPPRKTIYRANLFHASQLTSLAEVESAAWEIQGLVRRDTLPRIIEDVLEEEDTNALLLVLSSIDEHQHVWLTDTFPNDADKFPGSLVNQILCKLSKCYLLSKACSTVQQQTVTAAVAIIKALNQMEFIPASPVDEKSKTQRQMKNRRRAMTKSKSLDMELLKLFDLDIPENQDEVDEAKGFVLTQQKSILQSYLDAFRSEDLINDIMQSAVVQQEVVVDRSDLPAQLALPIETVERVESSAYPRVQPMKSALYFDTPEGFGDWLIFIGPSADSELRRRHKRERTTFDIIVKKMKELSNGHFSPDNHKRLGKSGSKSAVYEAKMTSDLRLVYQVDLVPNSDERVRQAIKIFGIFTHAQMENNRIWESIDHQLGRKSKEYKEYCAIRQRVLGADSHTFTPAYFPPLPEGLDDMQPSNILSGEAEDIHSRFLMEKYVQLSQPLMNTMLADLDAVFPHLVSPQEKLIIEHPTSCYVIGRSGTGKTTTLIFKMLLVERTYKLAKPGIPKPRQVFVTQSRILAKKVKQYFATIDWSLEAGDICQQELSSAPEDDMIHADDVEDWYGDLPPRFSQLEDQHFPLFLTWDKLCEMLEADIAEHQLDLSGSERALVSLSSSSSSPLLNFSKFEKHYWPNLPQPLTKKTDPALAFSEVIGVIKGSEAALSRHPHLLDRASYESVCSKRQALFASDAERFYSLFEAYMRKKLSSGSRDVADRTHDILDFFHQFGVPGQKVDHLYVDEVQDNLLIDTLVLRAICLNSNGLFWAGDTAQGISAGSAFRFNELKAFQWRLENEKAAAPGNNQILVARPEIFQLAVNYRSHSGIVNCAHSVIELINRFWRGSIDDLAPEKGIIEGPKPIFFPGQGSDKSILDQYLFGDSGNRIEFGAQQCILVRDEEARERLRQAVGGEVGLILTIYESKGLEFNDVLLYDFFNDSSADTARWRLILNAVDGSSIPAPTLDSHKHANIWLELKFLYVAITRARENVWIADSSNASEPMKMYWTSRNLIRTIAPGSQAPRLATSSSPEEWLRQGRTLFEQHRYPQAKHCFEKARRPNYVIMAEAYILRDDAEAKDGRARKRAFQEAAKAFRTCSERFRQRQSDYLRLSANCSYKAGDIGTAAQTYEEGGLFDDAVICYRELRMFDKAVEIVKEGKVKSTSLVDNVIRVARLFYFSEVQSLPPSDPRRAVQLTQGTRLFETSEEALEYAEERDLDIARGDILVAHLRFSEAAELHWSEGRPMEAIDLFLKEGSSESIDRAGQCIIEGLWQRISFAVRRDAIRADPTTLRLLELGRSIEMDEKNQKELAMFDSILSASTPATAFRERGQSFLLDQNLAASILCLENYFSTFARLRDWNIPLQVVAEELELFLQYITLLISELKAFPSESNDVLSKLFGFRIILNDRMLLSPGSFLFRHCDEAPTTEGIALAPVKLSLLLKSSVMSYLQWQMEQENELCKNIKAFSLCLSFSVAGICTRPSCTKAHIEGHNLTAAYYTLRVRVHLQQVLLFRRFPFEPSKYSHSRRRFWLRRLYEAIFPPHPVMGNMTCFDIQNVPEMQGNAVTDIKYWILGFVYSHRLLPLPPFLTLLSYGTSLLITAAPSFLTLRESGILSTYSSDARYMSRGQWKWAKFPLEYRHESGNVVYDLLWALGGTASNSLTKGILCLRHIILRKLDIDVSVLCDFIEYLCRNLIFSAACHYNGALHNVMFPRSWLLSTMDVDNLRTRDFNHLNWLIGPIAELLAQIHTGVDAGHLKYETISLAHNIVNGNIVRSTFITRICRAFALFGYNYYNSTIRQAIFYALTALRHCDPPPPPSAPWSRYAFAEHWGAIARTVRNSANNNPMDEMVHLLHVSKLPNPPLPNFPSVRYIVYNRLDELPDLLRRQDTSHRPLTAVSTDLDQNDAETMEIEDVHVHMEDGNDTQHAAAPASTDEDPNVMSAEEKEREERILSRLPSIYRENRWRRQRNRTRMAERRNEFFLSCLEMARDMPSGRYRKMALGPLPHVLSSLQAMYDVMHDFKRKTKDWMKQPLDHEELDRLDQQLTQTNSAIKEIVSLRNSLGPESSIHLTCNSDALKGLVSQLNALASEGLPISLPEDVREELAIGWKGIVKKKKMVQKREKPKLNTEDLFS